MWTIASHRAVAVAALIVLGSISVYSQVANPTHVTFAPSPMHSTTSYYEVRVKNQATSAILQTVNIGKPTPVAGVCKAALNTAAWVQGVTYTVEVRAVLTNGRRSDWVLASHTGNVPVLTPPPASTVYGPQTSITCPSGAVPIAVGASIQSAVNARANGTVFCLAAGTHVRQQVQPKTGQQFIGAYGAIMDGQNAATVAFQATTARPTGVTVKNLEIKNYKTPAQYGAFVGDNGAGWIVQNNSVHDNAYLGIRGGPGWRIQNNRVYRNGVIGISGFRAHGIIVSNNEVYQNNLSQAAELPVNAAASGMKFGETNTATISNNNVHHNLAKGIWTDHCGHGNLVQGNTVTDNKHDGIMVEISTTARVTGNTVLRNAIGMGFPSAGIKIISSRNIEVDNNTVRDNERGIVANQSSSLAPLPGETGTIRLENLNVHHNTIRMTKGYTGLTTTSGNNEVYSTWNNQFTANTYSVPNSTGAFWFSGSVKTWTQWQALGRDTGGTRTVTP